MEPPATPTSRLYWQNPRARTALAHVAGHASGGFLLDRTIFHAPRREYHHLQPCDRGHALAEGHKLKVHKVGWDARGRLVHRTDGPLPAPGAKAQLHLDDARRDLNARAHTAMHLVLAALAAQRAEHQAAPEVVGGGESKYHVKTREAPEAALKKVEARVRQLVDARLPVAARWVPRDEAARVATTQHVPLDAVAPGEPTLRLVEVGEACVLPCDAPLVEHSWQVGAVRVSPPQPARGGEGWRFRVKVVA